MRPRASPTPTKAENGRCALATADLWPRHHHTSMNCGPGLSLPFMSLVPHAKPIPMVPKEF